MPSAEEEMGMGNGKDWSTAFNESRRLKEEVDELAETIKRARAEWEQLLRQSFEERPYTTLAAAAGVGFVIGGGLSPGVMRAATGMASRLALGMLFHRLAESSGIDTSMGAETE